MEFSDYQRLFLAAACTHFHTTADWPTYGFLDRQLRHHKRLEVEEVGRELDGFIYDLPHAPLAGFDPERAIILSLPALYACQVEGICLELAEDLDTFMQVVHVCIERYDAGEENSPITEAEVRDRFGLSDLMLRKVFRLVTEAGLSSQSGHAGASPDEPVNWSFTVYWIIRKYRDVATIEDYLAVRQKLGMPRTQSPFYSAAHPQQHGFGASAPASTQAVPSGEALLDMQVSPVAVSQVEGPGGLATVTNERQHHDPEIHTGRKVTCSIFINYRRADSAGHAGRLYGDLARHFGQDAVFMDISAIPPGKQFGRVIS